MTLPISKELRDPPGLPILQKLCPKIINKLVIHIDFEAKNDLTYRFYYYDIEAAGRARGPYTQVTKVQGGLGVSPPEICFISRLNLVASGEFQGNFQGCILYRAAVKITTGVLL